jgi:hypothetical protein
VCPRPSSLVALGEAPATLCVRGTIRDLASFRSSALSRPLRGWSGREQDRMEARADDLGRQAIQISNALTQNHRESLRSDDAGDPHRGRGAGPGRKVRAFLSQNHIGPDLAAEIFVLESQPDEVSDVTSD